MKPIDIYKVNEQNLISSDDKNGIYDIDLNIFSNNNYFADDMLDTKDTFKIDHNLVKDLNIPKLKNNKKYSHDNQMLNQFKKMQTNKAITCSSKGLLEKASEIMSKNNLYKIKSYFVGTGILDNYN